MSGRTMTFAGVLVFAAALGIVVGLRLSEAALPIALGVAVGVTVGVPVSLGLAALTGRMAPRVPRDEWQAQPSAPQRNVSPVPQPPQSGYRPQTTGREFTVVGGASAPAANEDDE